MLYLAYILSLLMGFILGLMGAGGAILTIPILVYMVGMDAQLAISCSLFIICITSLTGGIRYIINKQVHFRSILLFGIPSVIAVWIVRKFVLPVIPDNIIQWDNFNLNKSSLLLFLFALIMMMAAFKMIRPSKKNPDQEVVASPLQFIWNGLLVGGITGLLGVGGGFLIVPALVIIQKLDFKIAAGTSLCIIAINSAIGFISNTDHIHQLDWNFLLIFTGIAITGIFLGAYVSKFYSSNKLQPAFGYLLVVISLFIFFEEIYSLIA